MLKKQIINSLALFENGNFSKNFPLNYCLPVYHCVSDDFLPHLKHIIKYKNIREFEADLDTLSKHFQWISFDEFKEYVKGNFKPKKKIALLTFDDGFREFYDIVLPILERKGIYALNFINPAFIDNKELMFRCKASLLYEKSIQLGEKNDSILQLKYHQTVEIAAFANQLNVDFNAFLKEQKPYLSAEQLKKIKQKGFGISSHGWNHPLYKEISLVEKLNDCQTSFNYMKEHGFHQESFAFPFTDFGVEQAFFDELFTSEEMFCTFGSAGIKLDSEKRNFQRIPMETGENAEVILKKEIAYFRLKKYLHKNTIVRK